MKNTEIKESFKQAGLFQWQVAGEMGIGETTFSRKMRNKISEEEKELINEAIESLKIKNIGCVEA